MPCRSPGDHVRPTDFSGLQAPAQERDGKQPLELPDFCISSCLLAPGRRKAAKNKLRNGELQLKKLAAEDSYEGGTSFKYL